ncbi:MAG: copper oxidase, partial [Myxococcota bacterium]
YIDMGGMFTVLKVRDDPDAADPAGWYEHPPGTLAGPADPAKMAEDLG